MKKLSMLLAIILAIVTTSFADGTKIKDLTEKDFSVKFKRLISQEKKKSERGDSKYKDVIIEVEIKNYSGAVILPKFELKAGSKTAVSELSGGLGAREQVTKTITFRIERGSEPKTINAILWNTSYQNQRTIIKDVKIDKE